MMEAAVGSVSSREVRVSGQGVRLAGLAAMLLTVLSGAATPRCARSSEFVLTDCLL